MVRQWTAVLVCAALVAASGAAAAIAATSPASAPHAVGAEALGSVLSFPGPLGELSQFLHPHAGPIAPGQGFLPLGNLLTSDFGGPYNLSLLATQENEIKAAIAFKGNYTDMDLLRFITNLECLEAQFEMYGVFGRNVSTNLTLSGPVPLGAKQANLTEAVRPYVQEIALSEQGHLLFTRQAGSTDPCPLVDIAGGFNAFFANVYGLPPGLTLAQKFGSAFDPFANDVNFLISMLTLEELGATGSKGAIGLTTNPVLASGIAGLATSATTFAGIERLLLYHMRSTIVQPFNETALRVFARVSALRDSLDGAQLIDQGLVNTDPRFIIVPDGMLNLVPTDIRGLTYSRTPAMLISILTLGSPDGKGAFFPNGLNGVITTRAGYDASDEGTRSFAKAVASGQGPASLGTVQPPLTGATPPTVAGGDVVFQGLTGVLDSGNGSARGLATLPNTITNTLFIDPSAPNDTTPVVNYTAVYGSNWGAFPKDLPYAQLPQPSARQGNATSKAARASMRAARARGLSAHAGLAPPASAPNSAPAPHDAHAHHSALGPASAATEAACSDNPAFKSIGTAPAVCRLYIFTANGGPTGGAVNRCTGWFVGALTVITSAHCIYEDGKYEVEVYSGSGGVVCCNPVGIDYPDECPPSSQFNIVGWVADEKFRAKENADNDVAALRVATVKDTDTDKWGGSNGKAFPWGSIAAAEPCLDPRTVTYQGFPVRDTESGCNREFNEELYTSSDEQKPVNCFTTGVENNSGKALDYEFSSCPACSGGPLFLNSNRNVIGVLSESDGVCAESDNPSNDGDQWSASTFTQLITEDSSTGAGINLQSTLHQLSQVPDGKHD